VQQITKEYVETILKDQKITLKSTQKKLCFPIINRIYKKMKSGIKFSAIKVDENLIIDGHHRYIASIMAEVPLELIPSNMTSATTIIDWSQILLDSEDWDTTAKINMLNAIDAEFNNISFEKLDELTK
jgi:hypothetical protein